ncbi:PqqD family peptide modification chaperone [Altererythrobacter luteolus]|uniref:PqqD family peptide modification chaperone n=1 Tax=Pontixanthobacter luteolus TaxID=295089 RepID=A0A6I4V660_9SPHN|nr:PqqD family protein [Pontixanthobacter luteolus]MXP47794.1 PqqD family peptide modification chaperone [Pontixanthobacter luteolus]
MSAIRKASGEFIETDVDDETIIVSLASGELFSVKETGLAIWKLIDGSRDRGQLITALSAAYSVDETEIAYDIDAFLTDAARAGLLA